MAADNEFADRITIKKMLNAPMAAPNSRDSKDMPRATLLTWASSLPQSQIEPA
jgi:hypothetical protein